MKRLAQNRHYPIEDYLQIDYPNNHNQRGLVLQVLRGEAGLLFKRTTQHCRRSPVRRSSGRKVTEMPTLLETLRVFATKESLGIFDLLSKWM